jgi:hypothetical protein
MTLEDVMNDAYDSGELSNSSIELATDLLEALILSPSAIKKVICSAIGIRATIRDKVFVSNLNRFLMGLNLDDKRQRELREALEENDKPIENVNRILLCIDKIETNKKIDFLIYATKALMDKHIFLADYFRICQIISNTLDEDLIYLKENILNEDEINNDVPYNTNVQGLLTSGLMYQTILKLNGGQGYYFTNIAVMVDKYALSYLECDKYKDVDTNIHRSEVGMQSVGETREMNPERVKWFKEKCII